MAKDETSNNARNLGLALLAKALGGALGAYRDDKKTERAAALIPEKTIFAEEQKTDRTELNIASKEKIAENKIAASAAQLYLKNIYAKPAEMAKFQNEDNKRYLDRGNTYLKMAEDQADILLEKAGSVADKDTISALMTMVSLGRDLPYVLDDDSRNKLNQKYQDVLSGHGILKNKILATVTDLEIQKLLIGMADKILAAYQKATADFNLIRPSLEVHQEAVAEIPLPPAAGDQ